MTGIMNQVFYRLMLVNVQIVHGEEELLVRKLLRQLIEKFINEVVEPCKIGTATLKLLMELERLLLITRNGHQKTDCIRTLFVQSGCVASTILRNHSSLAILRFQLE